MSWYLSLRESGYPEKPFIRGYDPGPKKIGSQSMTMPPCCSNNKYHEPVSLSVGFDRVEETGRRKKYSLLES